METFPLSSTSGLSSPAPGGQLQPGAALVNRYLIECVIGVGGMGAVYRARDLHFPNVTKWVAVKEMINQAADPLVRRTLFRNFEREANLLATLSHPSIPRIYDTFNANDRSYLILEYIPGQDLEAIVRAESAPLAENRVIAWAIELCDVLAFLHGHQPDPVIFRDMKPSNVMITPDDHVVLVDFGIARQFQEGVRGTMIGTEGYSPPEQYRGEAGPQTDLYALGATLHHLLTRCDPRQEAPFSFGERPVRRFNPEVSAGLEAVIYKALQYSPEDRYQSAAEMKAALVALTLPTPGGRAGPLPAPGAAPTTGGSQPLPVWTFCCEDELRGAPLISDGILYVGSYDHHLYALDAGTGRFLWKFRCEGGVVSRPAVHENCVYFGSQDTRLHVLQTKTGRLNWTYFTGGPVHSSPHIAEAHVFIGSDDGRLHAVHTASGRRTWEFDCGSPVRSTPTVDRELIFFGTEAGDFFCLDLRGVVKWRFHARRAITASPVISNGVVYFSSVDATLYALEAKTGWMIWRFRLGKPSISSPCVANGLVFSGAADGTIVAVQASTVREAWRYQTGDQVTGSPVIAGDSLYCGSVDGRVYCLEYRTGRLRWQFQTQGPITGTAALNNGMMYIGSTDHHLYALMA